MPLSTARSIERTIAWLHKVKRLRIRFDRLAIKSQTGDRSTWGRNMRD
ncbi:hypothetical protein [Cupriavidus sp. PET2-C1]|jgi:hypothetical protein